jgi:putative tricarboxylic transport membrane protein
MELLQQLALGLSVAVQPANLFYAFVGAVLGTIIGVLPGVGPVATISVLLPVTFGLNSTSAIIMLAGIYYGAQYGGSTTAILVKLPGESSSVVTTIDGYQMARQGKAGLALATAASARFSPERSRRWWWRWRRLRSPNSRSPSAPPTIAR